MTQTQQTQPPKLQKTASGDINTNSLADLLEWFLNYDQRVALVRNPQVEELFQWKQADDAENGVETYPFENAESRFAIGVFQALGENDSAEKLHLWIADVLQALGEAKQTNEEIAKNYDLEKEKSHIEQAAENFVENRKTFVFIELLARSTLHGGSQISRLDLSGIIRKTIYDLKLSQFPFQSNFSSARKRFL